MEIIPKIIAGLSILFFIIFLRHIYIKYIRYPRRFYVKGKLFSEKFKDGFKKYYRKNGSLEIEVLPDGTRISYDEYGDLDYKNFPDGRRESYENGRLDIEVLPDKTKRYYYEEGTTFQKDPDKTEIWYDKDNNIESIKYPGANKFKPQSLKN